mgnify:CR=1 FL=1
MPDRFYGTFTPRLDDKGRVTLPARYRKPFAEGAMVVRGNARCLYVFTVEGFDHFAEEAINAPVTDAAATPRYSASAVVATGTPRRSR